MKRVLLSIILLSTASITQAFPYDQYTPVNLAELITSVDEDNIKNDGPLEKRYLYLPATRHNSIVIFTGKTREIPDSHKKFLADILKSMPFIPKSQIDLYTIEVLIKSGNREIWALVQGPVFPYLEKEVKPGDEFKIFYMWFGATQYDHIIAINDFITKSSQ